MKNSIDIIYNMEHMEPIAEAREAVTTVVSSAYSMTLNSIFMALALTVALAWYAVVKEGVKIRFPESKRDGIWALIGYAIIITIVFTIAVWASKKLLGHEVPERQVMFAVAPTQ